MDFTAGGILARMKSDLKNEDTRIEGSFSMDNLQAVSEELARFNFMRIVPLMNTLTDRESDMGTSGNEKHYVRWAKEAKDTDGKLIVGNAKINAPRDGTGVVYISILTVDAQPPTEEQIAAVQEYINGKRPVGAEPIVSSAEGMEVSIACSIEIASGYTKETVKSQIKNEIQAHFIEIAFQNGVPSINYYEICNIVLDVSGVGKLNSLTINGAQDSIDADYNKYFILKELMLNVTE